MVPAFQSLLSRQLLQTWLKFSLLGFVNPSSLFFRDSINRDHTMNIQSFKLYIDIFFFNLSSYKHLIHTNCVSISVCIANASSQDHLFSEKSEQAKHCRTSIKVFPTHLSIKVKSFPYPKTDNIDGK